VPAALLVLAGCSDPQPANDTLPTAGSTSASPTLEPLGPADFPVPDQAREQTEAGAEAMARYYLQLTARSFSSLDSTWLRQLSSDCSQCTTTADNLDANKAAGARYEGGAVDVTTLAPELDAEGRTGVGVLVEQQPLELIGSDGTVVEDRSSPARRLTGGLVLSWNAERTAWLVEQLDLQTS